MKIYSSQNLDLFLDYTDAGLSDVFLEQMKEKTESALLAMDSLEAGAIANPNEGRMVGHYWLRAPELAPDKNIREKIENCNKDIEDFVRKVHSGEIRPQLLYPSDEADAYENREQDGICFRNVLVCGIGGSSLGPEFISKALADPSDRMKLYFLDNTDPAGFDKVFEELKDSAEETLVIVISKSGGTVETRNCMLEIQHFFNTEGIDFPSHAVCITSEGSKLCNTAKKEGWLKIFPMWDWVGGRTSVMSAVGLLPLGLQGIDTKALLEGAAECDCRNRDHDIRSNPAALMALAWYAASGGKGGTTDVILPYRDSLALLPKYLQQLVMESLGKEYDLDGNLVNQGLAVMGNKGSSDQHSYVQQLIAGPSNVFVTFIQVLKDREGVSPDVGCDSTSGDYLSAFMLGTAKALKAKGKGSIIISVPQARAADIGRLIALFERSVGIYAQLINVNAYDQPAVELGKKAADSLIDLKNRIVEVLKRSRALTAEEVAAVLKSENSVDADPDDCFRLLLHLSESNAYPVMIKAEAPVTDSSFFWQIPGTDL